MLDALCVWVVVIILTERSSVFVEPGIYSLLNGIVKHPERNPESYKGELAMILAFRRPLKSTDAKSSKQKLGCGHKSSGCSRLRKLVFMMMVRGNFQKCIYTLSWKMHCIHLGRRGK